MTRKIKWSTELPERIQTADELGKKSVRQKVPQRRPHRCLTATSVERSERFYQILDNAQVEDFVIEATGRSVTEVAAAVVEAVGWS